MLTVISVGSYVLNVKKVLRDSHDVLKVEKPSQNHFDRKRSHRQQQEHHHVEANGSQRDIEAIEPLLRKQWRQHKQVRQDQNDAEELAHEHVLWRGHTQKPDPDDFRQVDVVQGFKLVDIPIFIRPEEVPVRTSQERSENDQEDPEDQETKKERSDLPLSFLQRVVAISLGIGINVGNRSQPHDDQSRKDHAGQPRIVVNEHFLETKEVPW